MNLRPAIVFCWRVVRVLAQVVWAVQEIIELIKKMKEEDDYPAGREHDYPARKKKGNADA
jgi:hypothetical protein